MINYRLKINLQDAKVLTSDICFVSGDVNSSSLIFEFYDNGKRVDISNYTLSVRAKRSDGVVIAGAGTIQDNVATFVPENNFFAVPGELYMEIALSDSAGRYATTKIIIASVVQGLGEAAIEGVDNLSVYVTLLNDIQRKIDQANILIEESVPKKGVDYWTDKDKAEIKEYVDELSLNKLTYKGKVTELPTENVSVGDVYETIPAVKKLYTGKVSDYFAYYGGPSVALGIPSYTAISKAFDYSSNMEYFEQAKDGTYYRAYIYDMDGNLVLSKAERDAAIAWGYDAEACNFGGTHVVLFGSELKNLTGWDDELGTESEVSFYICKTRYNEGLPNGGFHLWDGDEWVDLLNTKQVDAKADKEYVDALVGDIETALDSIIAIQNELIGGA